MERINTAIVNDGNECCNIEKKSLIKAYCPPLLSSIDVVLEKGFAQTDAQSGGAYDENAASSSAWYPE